MRSSGAALSDGVPGIFTYDGFNDVFLNEALAVATGAGAEMRQSLGTAVFSGMLGVTLFGLLCLATRIPLI